MQIVIPMSGFGERFRRAGYQVPKPLIEIEDKPILAHVVEMFPGETDFIFVCNEEHLAHPDYHMREIIEKICPSGRVVGIAPHRLGPVHAVRQVEALIDDSRPVIVNYCDFTCYWDWHHFKSFIEKTKCAGALPAYKGFHPHSLGTTNYAYIREARGWALDIQEKQPFTQNRMNEFASSGTYYFSSGQLMKRAFQYLIEQDLTLGGEYYVSLAYKALFAEKASVAVYPLQHFMQWGTPEDVSEYNQWSSCFRKISTHRQVKSNPQGTLLLPMAGLGQRFVNEGYTLTKPLIPVSGRAMVEQALLDFPPATQYGFVLREDMAECDRIKNALSEKYPGGFIESLPEVTEGQACTVLAGLNALSRVDSDESGVLTVGACDHGMIYNVDSFQRLLKNTNVDVIIWAVRGHVNAIRSPHMFGWIDECDGKVQRISVKTPLSSPATDPIVLGTFTFRRKDDLEHCIERLIKRDGKVNGEFYLDSCIQDALELGLNCHVFEVDHYISWGTPNDLKTFEYWQSCFHKWHAHPYRLETDTCIPHEALDGLIERSQSFSVDVRNHDLIGEIIRA
jgi:NDP-sugar pyrophosphorylase family protein